MSLSIQCELVRLLEGHAFGIRSQVVLCGVDCSSMPDSVVRHIRGFLSLTAGGSSGSASALQDTPQGLFACLIMALQRQVNIPVFDEPVVVGLVERGDAQLWLLAIPAWTSTVPAFVSAVEALRIAKWACEHWAAADAEPDADRAATVRDRALEAAERLRYRSMNPVRFARAAFDLDIPFHVVDWKLGRYGWGRRRIFLQSSFTGCTPAIAGNIAADKSRCSGVLAAAGLPVPMGVEVDSSAQAREVASRIGYPVVVKPANLDQGKGVASGLTSPDLLAEYYEHARQLSPRVIVQRHHSGDSFRLTVVAGKVCKVNRMLAGGVTGDGRRSVAELAALMSSNAERQRWAHERGSRNLLAIDREAEDLLAQIGLSPDAVPAAGQFVRLRRRSNVSAGGSPELIPGDHVHPDNLALAIRAAEVVGLDLAGVDLISTDISRSWLETGAVICEVNAMPQIGDATTPRLYHEILNDLVECGGRIPAVLVIGDYPAEDLAAAIDWSGEGLLGVADTSSAFVSGRGRLVGRFDDPRLTTQTLCAVESVGAIVTVASWSQLTRSGSPLDRYCATIVDAPVPESLAGDAVLAMRGLDPHLGRLERAAGAHFDTADLPSGNGEPPGPAGLKRVAALCSAALTQASATA